MRAFLEIEKDFKTDFRGLEGFIATTHAPACVEAGFSCDISEDNEDTSHAIWVVFRGSHDFDDWLKNVQGYVVPWPYGSQTGKVHKGFLEQYSQARQKIKSTVFSMKMNPSNAP